MDATGSCTGDYCLEIRVMVFVAVVVATVASVTHIRCDVKKSDALLTVLIASLSFFFGLLLLGDPLLNERLSAARFEKFQGRL